MARKRSAPSRMDLRRQAEALEAKERADGEEVIDEEEEEEDEDAEGESDESPEEGDADEGDGGDDDDDAPKKKKAKPKAKAKPKKEPAPKRTRAPKEVRMKALWVIMDNGGKRVETFPFSQKPDAEAALVKRQEEKKGTFYLQLVKDKYDE